MCARASAQPSYSSLRQRLETQIENGKISAGDQAASVVDSLDLVDLDIEAEELGFEPTVQIQTIQDLLWFIRAVEFRATCKRRMIV